MLCKTHGFLEVSKKIVSKLRLKKRKRYNEVSDCSCTLTHSRICIASRISGIVHI